MSNALEIILAQIGETAIGWYISQINLTNIVNALFLLFINVILFTLILAAFPFLKPLANLLTWPFRFIHHYAHIYSARTIEMNIQEDVERQKYAQTENDTTKRRILESTVYQRFEIDQRLEGSNIIMVCNSLDDVVQIAMEPWKDTLIGLIVFIIIIFPFGQLLGGVGIFLHIYFALALSHGLIPTSADYQRIIDTVLREGMIPQFCVRYWFYVVFLGVFFETTLRTNGNIIIGLIIAHLTGLMYIFFLISIARYLGGSQQLKYPRLIQVPDEKSHDSKKSQKLFPSLYSEID